MRVWNGVQLPSGAVISTRSQTGKEDGDYLLHLHLVVTGHVVQWCRVSSPSSVPLVWFLARCEANRVAHSLHGNG